jgi:hypothetical protein
MKKAIISIAALAVAAAGTTAGVLATQTSPPAIGHLITESGAVVTYTGAHYGRGYFPELPRADAQVIEVYTFTADSARDRAINQALTDNSYRPSAYGPDYFVVVGPGGIPASLIASRLGATPIAYPSAVPSTSREAKK